MSETKTDKLGKPIAPEGTTLLLMDLKKKQVGCVLLQAVYGGDQYLPNKIGTEHWFLAPTPDMGLYPVPNDEIPKVVEFFKKLSAKKNG